MWAGFLTDSIRNPKKSILIYAHAPNREWLPLKNLQQIWTSSLYSETTTTRATQRLQPIRNRSWNKELSVRTSRETVLFFILNFWPISKILRMFPYGWIAEKLLILLLRQQIILDADRKNSVARQKRNALRIGKSHPGEWPGCFYVNKTSVQISLFSHAEFQPYKHAAGVIQG